MVLDLAGLLAREQALRRETEILRDANIALTENLSLDRILETLLDYLTKLVPYDSANVMLRQGDSQFVVSALRSYEHFQDVETTRAIAFDGNATFEYTVSDGTLTDVGLVTITLMPRNDAPVAVDDMVATAEDMTATIAASTLLANDTDVDSTLMVTAVANAMHGSVSLSGTTITFVPEPDFTGMASFEYTVWDGSLTDTGLVIVVVGGVNDPPVADFDDPARVKRVELDPRCRQQQVNDACFPTLAEVPRHALSLTLPVFARAGMLACIVPTSRKAAAVKDTLLGPVGTFCPATLLRCHPNSCLFLDAAAASLLPDPWRDDRP